MLWATGLACTWLANPGANVSRTDQRCWRRHPTWWRGQTVAPLSTGVSRAERREERDRLTPGSHARCPPGPPPANSRQCPPDSGGGGRLPPVQAPSSICTRSVAVSPSGAPAAAHRVSRHQQTSLGALSARPRAVGLSDRAHGDRMRRSARSRPSPVHGRRTAASWGAISRSCRLSQRCCQRRERRERGGLGRRSGPRGAWRRGAWSDPAAANLMR